MYFRTLTSTTTCEKETGLTKEAVLQNKGDEEKVFTTNPIIPCTEHQDGCEEYKIQAKGFFSLYMKEMEARVLDGAKSLVLDAASCQNISFEPDGEAVKNAANFMTDEWHHKYDVKFNVTAKEDPKDYLSEYFSKTIKQLGDAAIKINYIQTEKASK